jgi:hypothetical protein
VRPAISRNTTGLVLLSRARNGCETQPFPHAPSPTRHRNAAFFGPSILLRRLFAAQDAQLATMGPIRSLRPGNEAWRTGTGNIMAEGSTKEIKIGDPDDGGIYVGKSATTGKDLHTALADEPEYLGFDEAFEAAAKMRKQPRRENAHVPTPEELNVNLYLNKDKVSWPGLSTPALFVPLPTAPPHPTKLVKLRGPSGSTTGVRNSTSTATAAASGIQCASSGSGYRILQNPPVGFAEH